MEQASPAGGVILFPGGSGKLKLAKGKKFLNKTGNFAIRVRQRFFHAGFTVVSADVPSDRKHFHGFRPSPDHAEDIGKIIS